MQHKFFLMALIVLLPFSQVFPCTVYKITKNGKTIVGNNEDWISPNSQFWFEPANGTPYGVMYMGLLNNFAQGAINEAGLVFDGFANPELPVRNTEGKIDMYIGTAIRKIMQGMRTVEEVKDYLSKINLSSLSSSQLVFVDRSGKYLIVEGDALILGEEYEKAFSNFYYSQISSLEEVPLKNFQNGLAFLANSRGTATLSYCAKVMQQFSSDKIFGTQYSTLYDLKSLTVRVHLFHDYSEYVEFDLKKELGKGNHSTMIADLFPKESSGFQQYSMYNDATNPTLFIEELIADKRPSEAALKDSDFNSIINTIGYEWLRQKKNPLASIKIFEYGIRLMPNDADLYDSLGEAFLVNDDWDNAIMNYAKSLSLDPTNDHAIAQLDEAVELRRKFMEKPFKQVSGLVDQYAQEALKKGNLNSVSVAIYRDGNQYHNYHGVLDKKIGNHPNDSTLFEIASISKVFLGTLMAKAVLEHKIALKDDIRKYLKEDYPNLQFQGTPIIIENLLTHTLGFKTPVKLRATYDAIAKGDFEHKELDYGMDDLLEELKTVQLQYEPGSFYDYNNVGSELGAYILEQVNQRSYEDQLQDFWKQLGMENTHLRSIEKYRKNIAQGYDENNEPAPFDTNPLLGGSAGIITTIPDLAKFMKFQLESDSPVIKEATKFLYKDDEGNAMGYLWQDMGVAKKEGFYYSKTGDANGIKSGMLLCPDSNYGQIVIVNNQTEAANNDWGRLFNQIETELIQYPKVNLYALTKPDFLKDKKKAMVKFNILKQERDAYYNTDLGWTLNRIGYDLLYDGNIPKAIEILEFAKEQAPESFNVYDSLGEAYFNAKAYKKSRMHYRKSLEINPKNTNAKEYLKKLDRLMGKT